MKYHDSRGNLVNLETGSYHFHRIPYEEGDEFKSHIVGMNSYKQVILECTTPDGVRHEGVVIKRADDGHGEGDE